MDSHLRMKGRGKSTQRRWSNWELKQGNVHFFNNHLRLSEHSRKHFWKTSDDGAIKEPCNSVISLCLACLMSFFKRDEIVLWMLLDPFIHSLCVFHHPPPPCVKSPIGLWEEEAPNDQWNSFYLLASLKARVDTGTLWCCWWLGRALKFWKNRRS